jgi:hypothetical protein
VEYLKLEGSLDELGEAWSRYTKYLAGVKDRLPSDVYEFALAPWHYDPADHRSLHDSWVEELTVVEAPAVRADDFHEGPIAVDVRQMAIHVRLLGAYHDGHTTLWYTGVRRYELEGVTEVDERGPRMRGHGDWLLDEVRLAPSGAVLHEVMFASQSRWLIECECIKHSTTIPPLRDPGFGTS